MSLENISVVLVETKTPGNIGSSVRAMKNMGISDLRLVNPVPFRDHPETRMFGYRSQEIIESARVYSSLAEALADVSLVILATTRKGKWKKDFLEPREAAAMAVERAATERVALVFGREESGVTIDEAQMAHFLGWIPFAVDYPSLNLSQAVMVLVYEVYQALGGRRETGDLPPAAAREKMARLENNLWTLMQSLEFPEDEDGLFYRSLKRALSRTRWTDGDVAVFDRVCKQVRWFHQNRTGTELPEPEES